MASDPAYTLECDEPVIRMGRPHCVQVSPAIAGLCTLGAGALFVDPIQFCSLGRYLVDGRQLVDGSRRIFGRRNCGDLLRR